MNEEFGSMSLDELNESYLLMFGEFYAVECCDNIERWRDDIINCLETRTKQNMSDKKYPWNHPIPEGCVI